MECTISLTIPTVTAVAYLDDTGIMTELYIGDATESSADALTAWGDLVDTAIANSDLDNPEDIKSLLAIADALEATASDLRASLALELRS
jgi:hypothetical protein